jgi:osmosensitive K+ channel His kinase sensor protein
MIGAGGARQTRAEPVGRAADGRPTADEMLDVVRRQAGSGARGRHRVYLGIAPGVGKTYTALEELHRRADRGTDVVLGFLETHGRPRTLEVAGNLEIVARAKSRTRAWLSRRWIPTPSSVATRPWPWSTS